MGQQLKNVKKEKIKERIVRWCKNFLRNDRRGETKIFESNDTIERRPFPLLFSSISSSRDDSSGKIKISRVEY